MKTVRRTTSDKQANQNDDNESLRHRKKLVDKSSQHFGFLHETHHFLHIYDGFV
jgi:hypothetical protein